MVSALAKRSSVVVGVALVISVGISAVPPRHHRYRPPICTSTDPLDGSELQVSGGARLVDEAEAARMLASYCGR
jgi:hypothetical protein